MSKKAGAAVAAVAIIATFSTSAVRAETGSLPGGTSIAVDISSPTHGTVFVTGAPVTIEGSASVGEATADKNTDLVFVLDTSGSTTNPSNVPGCGPSILECEKAAVRHVFGEAQSSQSPIKNIGLAAFPDDSALPLTAPGDVDIEAILGLLTPGNGTDFALGISRAETVLEASTAPTQLIVLLTDGDGSSNRDDGIEAIVFAFTIAGQQCSDPDLAEIVEFGLDGSVCAVVSDIDDLGEVIQEVSGATLDSVTVTVDDVPYTTTMEYGLPGSATFSAAVPAGVLGSGPHEICATATGSVAEQSGSIEDCVTIAAGPPGTSFVDCGTVAGDCTASASQPGKSTLGFIAPGGFDEPVTFVPNSGTSTACGGQTCRTGYDVIFPTTSATGPVVSLTVVTAQPVTLKDRLKAAVFLDNKQITAQCSNRVIVKLIRNLLAKPEPIPCITIRYLPTGQVEYFVKFNADPGVRFR